MAIKPMLTPVVQSALGGRARGSQVQRGLKWLKHARKSFVTHVHWIQHNPGMPFKTMNAKNLLLVAPGLYLQTPSEKWCQFHWPCSPQRFDELVGSIAHPRLWIERPHLCRPRRGPCKSSPICTNRLACLLLHLKGMVGFVESQPGVLQKFKLAQNSYIYNSEEPLGFLGQTLTKTTKRLDYSKQRHDCFPWGHQGYLPAVEKPRQAEKLPWRPPCSHAEEQTLSRRRRRPSWDSWVC